MPVKSDFKKSFLAMTDRHVSTIDCQYAAGRKVSGAVFACLEAANVLPNYSNRFS